MDKKKPIEEKEKEYDLLAEKYKQKYGFDFPWTVPLFETEREEILKIPNKRERLLRFTELVTIWNYIYLSDPTLDPENEIKNRMIPMIENEIRNLESQIRLVETIKIDYDRNIKYQTEKIDNNFNDFTEDNQSEFKLNLKEITREFFTTLVGKGEIDIKDPKFVSRAKKKLVAKINGDNNHSISSTNRETIRTYLSNLKKDLLKSQETKRRKK